jgi:hypothetical protein
MHGGGGMHIIQKTIQMASILVNLPAENQVCGQPANLQQLNQKTFSFKE